MDLSTLFEHARQVLILCIIFQKPNRESLKIDYNYDIILLWMSYGALQYCVRTHKNPKSDALIRNHLKNYVNYTNTNYYSTDFERRCCFHAI